MSDLKLSRKSLNKAAPNLYACVKSFLLNWPDFGTENPVNGGDLVEWIADQYPYWVNAVSKAEAGSRADPEES